jgi:hypothetical protein
MSAVGRRQDSSSVIIGAGAVSDAHESQPPIPAPIPGSNREVASIDGV